MSESDVDRVLARAVSEGGATSDPSEARARMLRRAAGVIGLVVAALGLTVAAAWVLDLHVLTGLGPGVVTMKFSTALCLTVVGAAIAVSAAARPATERRAVRTTVVLVVPVLAVALLTLAEDALGLTLPVDNPFGFDHGDASTPVPGRMAQMTAVSLVVLSAAGVLGASRRARVSQLAALVALAIGMTSLVGYSYGVKGLYGVGPFNIMAMHTALLVVAAAVGVLFLRPTDGYVAVCVGNTAGGVILRKVLPGAVLGPYLIGAAIAAGLHRGWYGASAALAIFVIVGVNVGAGLVWFQAERLRDVDLRRGEAEDSLRIAQEALAERDRIEAELAANVRRTHRILATAADAYIAIDSDGRVTDWNDAAVDVFGWSRGEAIGARLDHLMIPSTHAPAHRAGMARFAASGEALARRALAAAAAA